MNTDGVWLTSTYFFTIDLNKYLTIWKSIQNNIILEKYFAASANNSKSWKSFDRPYQLMAIIS